MLLLGGVFRKCGKNYQVSLNNSHLLVSFKSFLRYFSYLLRDIASVKCVKTELMYYVKGLSLLLNFKCIKFEFFYCVMKFFLIIIKREIERIL